MDLIVPTHQGKFIIQNIHHWQQTPLLWMKYFRIVSRNYFLKIVYSSSSRPVSMSWCHAHSRALVFHTPHRGQRDTRICHWISYILLRCTPNFAPPQESYFTSLINSSTPSPSALFLPLPMPLPDKITYSHPCIPTCSPWALSDSSHISNSDRVVMYCTIVFCRGLI